MSKTLLEQLRHDRHRAKRTLEKVKARHLKKYDNETWKHFFHRMHLHRRRRAAVRRIVKGYDVRIEEAIKRKEKRKDEKRDYDKHGGGLVPFDSTVDGVVEWIAYELTDARKHGWSGYAFSGYRSPEKSIALCIAMCGAPACPGQCGGASSNHAKKGDGQGAVDITEPAEFERIAYARGLRLHNDLPADLPHMSATGH